jgi:perosamine synthetase
VLRSSRIIEDAAQALGATIDGRPAGSFGTGCFSFYATKNITTGEGGVVTTDDQSVAETARVSGTRVSAQPTITRGPGTTSE